MVNSNLHGLAHHSLMSPGKFAPFRRHSNGSPPGGNARNQGHLGLLPQSPE